MKKFEHFKSNLRVLALAEKENLPMSLSLEGLLTNFLFSLSLDGRY